MGEYLTRGHDAALAFVERVVGSGRPPHALLLAGPERIGKTTLALDLAAGLLCLAESPHERPCRACAACRKVAHGNHPDLHRLAPEGAGQQIRIGQVQALVGDLALLPLEGRYRVAVIERAQRLNPDAQNALLKTLEEPPAAVVLILAADDSAALLPTVISRCARVRMGPVGAEVIGALLAAGGHSDAARGAALGRLASGRPGVALSLAARPEAALSRDRVARLLLDLLSADRRRRLAAQAELIADGAAIAAAAGGTPSSDEQADEQSRPAKPKSERRPARVSPAERRAAAVAVLAVWQTIARDVALAARGARRELSQRDLLDELVAAGALIDPGAMARFVGRLEAVTRAIDGYANPELALDALLLEWPAARRAA